MRSVLAILLLSTGVNAAGLIERQIELPARIEKPPVNLGPTFASLSTVPPRRSCLTCGGCLRISPCPGWSRPTTSARLPISTRTSPGTCWTRRRIARFDLPHRGKLGVFNTNSDVNFLLGLGVDDDPVSFNPKRQYIDHLLNLAAIQMDLGEVHAAGVVPAGDERHAAGGGASARIAVPGLMCVRVESVCTRPPAEKVPFDRYGYGVTATTGNLQWVGYNEPNNALISSYEEWIRQAAAAGRFAVVHDDRQPDAERLHGPPSVPRMLRPVPRGMRSSSIGFAVAAGKTQRLLHQPEPASLRAGAV